MRRFNIKINLRQFGSSSQTVSKQGEKSDALKNMDSTIDSLISPIAGLYDGTTDTSDLTGWAANTDSTLYKNFANADTNSSLAQTNLTNILNTVPSYLTSGADALSNANTLSDTYNTNAADAYSTANDYISNLTDLLANGTNSGLQNYLNNVNSTIMDSVASQASASLADLASRGIINSSTSNKSINNLEDAASSAVADAYADAFNNYAGYYTSGSDSARNLGDSYTNAANDSVSAATDLSNAYNDLYNSGINSIDTYADLPSTLYENAAAPITTLYNYWRDLSSDWLNTTYDTVTSDSKL